MRAMHTANPFLLGSLLIAGAVAAGRHNAAPPGAAEFTGCHRYPEGKRFRFDLRGEVSLGDLVALLGEVGCQTIIVGPGAAGRAQKVSIEVPDLLTASEVYRLFYAALESMGLTVEVNGRMLKVVDSQRAKEVSSVDLGGGPGGGLGGGAAQAGDQF